MKTTRTITIGLISKKQLCTCSTLFCTFLSRCYPRLQRETSRYLLVSRFVEEVLYVFLFTFFSLPLIITFVTAGISHFLTAAVKFSRFSSGEIGLRYFSVIAPALSLLSSLKDIQIQSKEDSALLLLCRGDHAIYLRNARGA